MENRKKVIIVGILLSIIVIISAILYLNSDYRKYSLANDYMSAENYQEAKTLLSEIEDYKDSKKLIETCEYELTPERRFSRSLRRSIEERWESENPSEITLENSKKEYPDKELELLLEYKAENFSDEFIGSLANKYIEALQNESKAFVLQNTNLVKAEQIHEKAIDDRNEVIISLINEGILVLNEDHKESIEKLNETVTIGLENKKENEDIQKMLDNIEYDRFEPYEGWGNMYFKVKNTTELNFERLWFIADVYDENGRTILSQDIVIDNFRPGDESVGMGSTDTIPEITDKTTFKYRLLDTGDSTIINYKN